jgi:hypothetical protein
VRGHDGVAAGAAEPAVPADVPRAGGDAHDVVDDADGLDEGVDADGGDGDAGRGEHGARAPDDVAGLAGGAEAREVEERERALPPGPHVGAVERRELPPDRTEGDVAVALLEATALEPLDARGALDIGLGERSAERVATGVVVAPRIAPLTACRVPAS